MSFFPSASAPGGGGEACLEYQSLAWLPANAMVCCEKLLVTHGYPCVTECDPARCMCTEFALSTCRVPQISAMCSGWNTCTYVAVSLTLAAVLLVSTCCIASVVIRTRQRRRFWEAQQQRLQSLRERRRAQAPPASRPRSSGIGDVELARVLSLGEEGLAELAVRKALPQAGEPSRECGICLEAKPQDAWVAFPCAHRCCQPCFADLIRHNSCIEGSVHLVQCPFCRQVATAVAGP